MNLPWIWSNKQSENIEAINKTNTGTKNKHIIGTSLVCDIWWLLIKDYTSNLTKKPISLVAINIYPYKKKKHWAVSVDRRIICNVKECLQKSIKKNAWLYNFSFLFWLVDSGEGESEILNHRHGASRIWTVLNL